MRDLSELNFEQTAPPLAESDLARFQHLIGLQLSSDYVEFLRQQNGGNPELDSFDLSDRECSAPMFFHLAMKANDGLDLLWAYLAHKNVLPSGVIPIATDGVGNLVCLDLRPNSEYTVLWWEHEVANDLVLAFVTFSDLLDALYLDPEIA